MACSFSALYLLWKVEAHPARALNGILFQTVFTSFGWNSRLVMACTAVLLALEIMVLMLAAHVGLRVGPRVLSTMAIDSWLPHQFRYLSDKLVTQNGMLVMGILALVMVYLTNADVGALVVLFSVNVFLVFSLALAGLVVYWVRHRGEAGWWKGLLSAVLGFVVAASVLVGTLVTQFFNGGWFTVVVTTAVVLGCWRIRKHYQRTRQSIAKIDEAFADTPYGSEQPPPELIANGNTAVFVVGNSRGGGMHALLWVQRMFPEHFQNFVFINARTVDVHAYGGKDALEAMKTDAFVSLNYFVNFCKSHGLRAKSYLVFGTDAVEELTRLAAEIAKDHSNAIFFTSKLVFEHENVFTRLLHNQAALELQRRLHGAGQQMVILPMRL
ncbi:MAG: amino acid permease [Limnobacter sp.]|nr:amino acid permease [Limnobacter sp.]